MADRTQFDEFVATRSPHLLRVAYLLTRNLTSAQDLLQEAYLKCWFAWSRISADPERYVRKALVNTYLSGLRRRWRGEIASDSLPEPAHGGGADEVADRLTVWQALGRLTRKQRALIVLRYFEDLTEAETADVLGISLGTVKSQTSRALACLRVDEILRDAVDARSSGRARSIGDAR